MDSENFKNLANAGTKIIKNANTPFVKGVGAVSLVTVVVASIVVNGNTNAK